MPATFSIIIPTYNRAAIICEAIDSIATQPAAKSGVEVVIVDDSTDDTVERARTCANQYPHCHLITHKDARRLGVTGARNKGIELATGDILIMLDSDDQLVEGSLAFISDFFDNHPDVDLLFGRIQNKSGRPAHCLSRILDRSVSYEEMVQAEGVGEFLPVVRRKMLIDSHLRYPVEAEGSEGILWRRIPKAGFRVWYSSHILRLYDDIGADRNSTPKLRVKRARVFATGHIVELREFGPDLRRLNPRVYVKRMLKTILYNRLAEPQDPAGDEFLRGKHPTAFMAASLLPASLLRVALEWTVRARQIGVL